MFQNLHKKTIELLSTKTENYLFERANPSENQPKPQPTKEFFSATALYDTLTSLYDQEEALIDLDDNEQVLELRKCMAKITALMEQNKICDNSLKELKEKYIAVTDKTSSLHNACDRMMSQQTQLAAGNEQIKMNLHYYQQYDWIMKKLQTSKLSTTGTLFTQILSSINECITYLKTHPEHREAETYLMKYEQCLSKALTAIKVGALSDLEICRDDVLQRQSQSYSTANPKPNNTGMAFTDDDTFALLYGVFGVKANSVRNSFALAHQYFADYPEYQTMVLECEQDYFQIREQLLRPVVNATVLQLTQKHKDSSCTLTRDGCSFLLRLCDDEFRLYKQFFVVSSDGSVGLKSHTPSPPVSPTTQRFWQQTSASFDSFIESMCRIFYDTLRPIIIHNQHLETLAQLCALLKVEMIEERCGALMSMMTDEAESFMNPRGGFVMVMSELVGDIVERIVYRTSLFAQSDILNYNPAPGDLSYPERLLMMKNIEKETSGVENKSPLPLSKQSSTSAIDLHCLWYPTVRRTIMCLSKLYKCLDQAVFVSIAKELLEACCQSLEVAVDRIRSLPIDPAKASVKSIGRSLDAQLFIVKHLLIIREQTSPYRASAKSVRNRSDSINSLDSMSQYDYSIDLSKYKNLATQLFTENRGRWFELSSNNAFLTFLFSSPVQISELQLDSRRIIEAQLKKHCHKLIRFVTDLIVGNLNEILTEIEQIEARETSATPEQKIDIGKHEQLNPKSMNDAVSIAFKNLKQTWPGVRSAFSLYIGVKETEEILLQPIRKGIVDIFTNVNLFVQKHYSEEQQQIASVPNQEQIWLLLNA